MPGRASTRWTRLVLVVATVLCIGSSAALTESGALLFGATAAAAASSGAASTAHSTTGGPPLTLVSQSPWVTPDQPWFNLEVAVGQPATSAASLHVSLTFYSRLDDAPQYEQSVGAVPDKGVLLRLPDVSVVAAPGGGLLSSACVTVLPNDASTAPASGVGLCAPGSPSLVLGCTPFIGTCGDVYPVSVALERQGASSPLARFTTFLTYEEPAAIGPGGPLRVAMVLPVGTSGVEPMATTLSDHRAVAATLAVSPSGVQQILARRDRGALRALTQLAGLDGDEVLDQSYVPINVAALSAAGIAGEIGAQLARGDTLLHEAGLRPAGGPWIDTDSSFSLGDGADLAAGLQAAGASELVLAPDDLASGGLSNYTFAQPFVLDTGHGTGVPAVSVNAALSGRFTAQAADPVLGAEQLVAGLAFVHYEDAYLSDPRGVVVTPPAGWRASTAFMETLLDGMSDNPALRPVTLGQLFSQVPVGGNREPTTLRLQSGPAGQGITRTAAQRIAAARVQLSSFTQAAGGPSGSQSTGGQSNGPSGGQSASDQAAAAQPAALTALSDAPSPPRAGG